jgi:hypothetical protein
MIVLLLVGMIASRFFGAIAAEKARVAQEERLLAEESLRNERKAWEQEAVARKQAEENRTKAAAATELAEKESTFAAEQMKRAQTEETRAQEQKARAEEAATP